MRFVVDDRIVKFVNGPVCWFADSTDPAKVIRDHVPAKLTGVYCLWWKAPLTLPKAPRIPLPAGNRRTLTVELKLHAHGLCDAAALYVGKSCSCVRSRLTSHIKPGPGRNPYWWMTQIVEDMDSNEAIRMHLGFNFIEEPSSVEQVYLENLAIGILRPWFNFRFTA